MECCSLFSETQPVEATYVKVNKSLKHTKCTRIAVMYYLLLFEQQMHIMQLVLLDFWTSSLIQCSKLKGTFQELDLLSALGEVVAWFH